MPGPRARLLVSGDLHLGRYPSRVPPGDPALGVDAVARALVDQAVERAVDAVVLTGDVADEANKYFEAYGVLERMLHRLVGAGIPVFAVAGNHDHDVLGSVADAVGEGVRVLGRGQTWEAATLTAGGRDLVRVVGWSYAGPHVHGSPLDTWPGAAGGVPTVGVVHGDLDAPGSPYAPVALADLRASGASAWLLGHVHAPGVAAGGDGGGPLVLYPGSPQPLDPGEPGPHGAWVVEVADDGTASAEMLPLATVRYDTVAVDLAGAATVADVRERVAVALREYGASARETSPGLRRAVVRVALRGRTAAYRDVEAVAAELAASGETTAGGLAVTLDGVDDRARPALDLDRLARGSGPVATLAGLAGRLEAGAPSEGDLGLIRRAAEALQQARRARVFEPLAQHERLEPDLQAEAVRRLRRQTYRLLDQALAQAPSDHAAPAEPVGEPGGDGVASADPSLAAPRPSPARPSDVDAPLVQVPDVVGPTGDAPLADVEGGTVPHPAPPAPASAAPDGPAGPPAVPTPPPTA